MWLQFFRFFILIFVQGAKGAKAAKETRPEGEVEGTDDARFADAKETRTRAGGAAKGSKDVWSKESDYY